MIRSPTLGVIFQQNLAEIKLTNDGKYDTIMVIV